MTNFFHVFEDRNKTILYAVVAFCFPVLLYIQTITFGFTFFDDDLIIKNHIKFLSNFQNVPQAFLTDAFTDNTSHFYRPLQTLSYMIDIQLSGADATWMFHLTQVLLLGFIAYVLFFLIKKFLIPTNLALLSTLIYCAHPLFVFSVALIPARGDLLLMLFSLLSFLFLMECLQKRKYIYLFGHCLTFVIALFCKETAAFLPVLYIIFYIFKSRHFEKKHFWVLLFYVTSGLFWLWLRSIALGDVMSRYEIAGIGGQNSEVGIIPVLLNWRTIPESLTLFFIPFDINIIPHYSLFKTLAGLALFVLLWVVFFITKNRYKKEKLFCVLWFILLWLPSLLYRHDSLDYLNHRSFLPLVGILLFVLLSFPEKWSFSGMKYFWIMIAVLIFFSATTFINSRSYSDPMTFYNTAISQNPKFSIGYYNRGLIYDNAGSFDIAIADYTRAIESKPDYLDAYYNRGLTYGKSGLYDKAVHDYSKAISLNPGFVKAYNNRGNAFCTLKEFQKAEADFNKAILLKPNFAEAFYNRGLNYGIQKSFDKAITDFTKAVELKPDYAEAYNNRGYTYISQKLFKKAISDLTKAIELQPDFPEAYNNRGNAYRGLGLFDKSCPDFIKAAELGSQEAKESYNKFCK